MKNSHRSQRNNTAQKIHYETVSVSNFYCGSFHQKLLIYEIYVIKSQEQNAEDRFAALLNLPKLLKTVLPCPLLPRDPRYSNQAINFPLILSYLA